MPADLAEAAGATAARLGRPVGHLVREAVAYYLAAAAAYGAQAQQGAAQAPAAGPSVDVDVDADATAGSFFKKAR